MAPKLTKVAADSKVIKTATKKQLVNSLDFMTSTGKKPSTVAKMKKPAAANKKRPAAAAPDVQLDDAVVESTLADRNKKNFAI